MSNLLSSGIILLFLVLLIVLIPVLQSTKAPGNFAIPSDQYSKKASEDIHRRKTANSSHQYSRKQRDGIISRQNSIMSAENLQESILKSKPTAEKSHHFKNALDNNMAGVKLYKERYPTSKPRKHYLDNNEVGSSINKKLEKYYYTKDSKKHKFHHRPVERPSDLRVPHHSPKTTSSKVAPPTAESVLKPEDGLNLFNLSEQSDFDFLDLANSSLNNESSSSNISDSEKSNVIRCPTCRMRDGNRRYRIEKLKQTILSSLHMTAPPNASKVSIPKVPTLEKLYQMDGNMMNDSPYNKRTNSMNDDHYTVKTERVFTKARQPPAQAQLNISDSLYFAPPIKLYTSTIKTAYLWFYIRKRKVRRPSVHLTIERILAESVPANRLITKTIFSQKLLVHRAFGWKRIDLRHILRHWVSHPMSNHGLQIRAYDDRGNNLVVLTPSPEVDRGYEPWLDTTVAEKKSNSRHRRSQALRCTNHSTEARCCRYPLTITFAEFGWGWIIAPLRIEADYCSGECQMTMQNVSPHSWLHQQVPGSSGSCCSPTKLAALPLLYFDEDYNVIYQILQNMKVEECGCT